MNNSNCGKTKLCYLIRNSNKVLNIFYIICITTVLYKLMVMRKGQYYRVKSL